MMPIEYRRRTKEPGDPDNQCPEFLTPSIVIVRDFGGKHKPTEKELANRFQLNEARRFAKLIKEENHAKEKA